MPELSSGAAIEGGKCEQLEKIVIGNDEEKFFHVGVQLPSREKKEVIGFSEKISTYLHGVLTRPSGWTQTSFVTI